MPTVAADVAFGLGRYDLPEHQVAAAVAAALELVNMQGTQVGFHVNWGEGCMWKCT
jgi:energy-coupling factor transporter ATP-binding protein EcfA2